MLDDPMLDPTGALVTELRADTDVATLVGTRVAAGESVAGWAQGAGSYLAFVVLVGAPAPYSRVPVSRATYTVRCYGATFQGATAVWGAVVKAIHQVNARHKASGLGIYITWISDTADQLRDPDTNQPFVEGTLVIYATAQAIA